MQTIETHGHDFFRAGSEPKEYDVEYSVDYRVRVSSDSADDEIEVTFDDVAAVTYYADQNDPGHEIEWSAIAPETRAKMIEELKTVAESLAPSVTRRLVADEFERRLWGDD
jgi:hypothetical protein